jgi:hypothetical protein
VTSCRSASCSYGELLLVRGKIINYFEMGELPNKLLLFIFMFPERPMAADYKKGSL